ncbi:PucR family transcriptional regulator [Planosporangium thailandense]|uniref:PucR family transcriptional regulator n=1 Tax=Planosporangium thailandense TaxID=765197 RepID=UPI0030B85155
MPERSLSERARQLIRQGAEVVLDAAPTLLETVDAATLSAAGVRGIADDPALAAALRRSNYATVVYWAAHNVRDPGGPVPPNLAPETLDIARDMVRRGLNEFALDAYRAGQSAAWSAWMSIIFTLTRDPDELREVLDVTAGSIAAFIESTIAALALRMQRERDELVLDLQAERREAVALVLSGAPITADQASRRLGYPLGDDHIAAVVWSDDDDADRQDLERAGARLAAALGERRPLTVVAGVSTLWVWVSVRDDEPVDLRPGRLLDRVRPAAGVRVAVGSRGTGPEGFRRSHLDALTTQRLLVRSRPTHQLATFEAVELVSLATQDEKAAQAFVARILGRLADADEELRTSVRTYLRRGCNVSAAAAELFVHRNTLLRRLTRADTLLPRPLDQHPIEVAVALELVRWTGAKSD